MTDFQPGDFVESADPALRGAGVRTFVRSDASQPTAPDGAIVRRRDGTDVWARVEDLRHVPVTAEHVGQWARITDEDSRRDHRGRRGWVRDVSAEGVRLRDDDRLTWLADPGCAVLVAPPEPPAPVPAFPFVGARAQVTVAALDDGTPNPYVVAGETVTVEGYQGKNARVLATNQASTLVATRHLRPVPVSPGPDQPTEHEDWHVGGRYETHVYGAGAGEHDEGRYVGVFDSVSDAARAVADHQDTPALRAEVQRLTDENETLTAAHRSALLTRDDTTAQRDTALRERDAARAELDAATTDGLGLPQVEVRQDADGYRLDAYVGGQWTHASIGGGDVNRLRQTVAATQALLRARLTDEAATDDKETDR